MEIDIDALAQDWKDKKEALCSKTAALKELIEDKKIQLKKTEENIEQMSSACNLAVFKSGLKNYFKGEFSGDPFMDAAFYLVYQEDTAPEEGGWMESRRENKRQLLSPLARVKKLYEQMKALDAALKDHYRQTFVFDNSEVEEWGGMSAWGRITTTQLLLGRFTGRKKPKLSVTFPENGGGDLHFFVENSYQGIKLIGEHTEEVSSEEVSGRRLGLAEIFRDPYIGRDHVKTAELFLFQGHASEYYRKLKEKLTIAAHYISKGLETPALQHLLREKS